jgi:protein TonB
MTAVAMRRTGAGRWGAALMAAALVHGGAVWAALHGREAAIAPSEPPPAVLIELERAPAAPPSPPSEAFPGPPSPQAEPQSPKAETGEAPTAQQPTVESQQRAEAKQEPPLAEPLPEPQPAMPPAPVHAEVEAVLPRPAAPPKARPRARAAELAKPMRRAEKPAQPRAARPERVPKAPESVARRASAPPSFAAPSAFTATAAASSVSASNASALASWKGAMLAHINRFKRYPPGATGLGIAYVAFSINGSGVVTSVRLTSSSGDPALDSEAVALLHRASPTPPPPSGAALTLNLPIKFNRN